ncbi:hypothetical protein N7474_008530 [Penicillium riverlandense]|uniref:uncharacterized protein n=1 Tax=Penicillium riverlandense TaxID=1903569 RepID=UPI002547343B|nr:uncharacterized protein N7474_008530 [Penicillium riverlandense]KAJ5812229.1 hypothetical protein N7474_008530 [Penicillium riverlandense]
MSDSEDIQQENNVWSSKYFALSMGAIMVLFMVRQWSQLLSFHYGPRQKTGIFARDFPRISLASSRFSLSKFFGFEVDRLLLYTIYWAINLILLLTNNIMEAENIARRLGWLSVANLALLVFLALKNTPLAPLTAQSYEKLRPLHKTAGYTCILVTVLHGLIFVIESAITDILYYFKEQKDYAGAIAGLAMILIAVSTVPWIMPKQYEGEHEHSQPKGHSLIETVFYMMHVTMFILIMVTLGMHRPEFKDSTIIITIFIACLWMYDRIVRTGKLCWNFFGNYATITPLPNNAIRVQLSRPIYSRPGSHAFLWVPAIRWVETHPFTMVSADPVQFVIRVYDGFTRDLYKAAQSSPGQSLRCSVDGGYGQVPNFRVFDKVVLVAGGSGASFTFAVALKLIENIAEKRAAKSIDFIWAVQYGDTLEWFEDELRQLEMSPIVNLAIHVTRGSSASSPKFLPNFDSGDLEKGASKSTGEGSSIKSIDIREGRPDISHLIGTATASAHPNDRIVVGACGPVKMIDQTRNAVSESMCEDGPSIILYTEEFEW